ncbi:hypothetical protein D3C84_689260 [compost metagenome]
MGDVQLRRRVLVDRPQQFKTALSPLRVAFLAVGAVAFESVSRVDDQRLTFARLGLERRFLQLFLIGADFQHPLLLFRIQRFGAAQQFAFAGRPILDGFHQAGFFHRFDRVGGNGGQRELFGQAQAWTRHLQQFEQAIGAVFVEEEIVELDLLEFPDVLDHARGFLPGQVQPVFPQVTIFEAAVFREFFLIRHQRKQARIAAHQTFPGVENAVVGTFDVGAEVDGVAEQ